MKNQFVPLVTSIAVVALLCCCVVLLLSMMPYPADPAAKKEEQEAPPSPVLFSLSPSELDTIELCQGEESFRFVNMGDHLVLEDEEEIPLLPDAEKELLSLLKNFTIEKKLSAFSENSLSDYGLDAPFAKIVITPVQLEPITLLLGNTVGDSEQYLTDLNFVYRVSSKAVAPLLRSKTDFADRAVTPQKPKELQYGVLRLSGKRYPVPLTIRMSLSEKGDSYHLMTPHEEPLREESCRPLIDSLFDLTADAAVSLSPTPAELHSVGMEEPYCMAECELDGERFLLLCSAPQEDGTVFLMNEAIPILFRTDSKPLEWLFTDDAILTSSLLLPVEYEETAKVVISSPSETFHFTKWDGQVLCNGKPIDQEHFHTFYTQSLAISPKKRAISPPASSHPLLTITISYNNPERKSDTLALLPGPDGFVFLSYNGTIDFLADGAIPSVLLKNCHSLLEKEPLSPLPQ